MTENAMLAYQTKLNKSKCKQYGKHVSHADYKDQMLSYHLMEKHLLHKKNINMLCQWFMDSEYSFYCRYSGTKSITDIQHLLFLGTSQTYKLNSLTEINKPPTYCKANVSIL
jgi:hypothetical protein